MAYIEFAKFKLRAGVSDEQFLNAERTIRAGKIQQQKGYLGREVGRGQDGDWYIVIRWETSDDGAAWSPIFMADPDGKAFAGCLDFSSMRQEHLTTLSV